MAQRSKVEALYADFDRRFLEQEIRPRITPALVEEHRRNPVGQHSPDLEIVLAFLRRDPSKERPRFVIVCTQPEREWCIGEYSRVRGEPLRICRDEPFGSEAEAEHAIFLRRLRNLGLWEK